MPIVIIHRIIGVVVDVVGVDGSPRLLACIRPLISLCVRSFFFLLAVYHFTVRTAVAATALRLRPLFGGVSDGPGAIYNVFGVCEPASCSILIFLKSSVSICSLKWVRYSSRVPSA